MTEYSAVDCYWRERKLVKEVVVGWLIAHSVVCDDKEKLAVIPLFILFDCYLE